MQENVELSDIIKKHQNEPGCLIPLLSDVQKKFGYISRKSVYQISSELNVPIGQIMGLITFYSFFSMKPKGEHLIHLCKGTACYVKGGARLLEFMQQRLGIKEGDITEDGKFTLQVVACLGVCALSPAVLIDDECYGNLDCQKVEQILASYRNLAHAA